MKGESDLCGFLVNGEGVEILFGGVLYRLSIFPLQNIFNFRETNLSCKLKPDGFFIFCDIFIVKIYLLVSCYTLIPFMV